MLEVLAEVVRAGDGLALGDPLLQVVDLAAQRVQLQDVVQLAASLFGQVLERRVQLVHLRLLHADRVTATQVTCDVRTAQHNTATRTACPPAPASRRSRHCNTSQV